LHPSCPPTSPTALLPRTTHSRHAHVQHPSNAVSHAPPAASHRAPASASPTFEPRLMHPTACCPLPACARYTRGLAQEVYLAWPIEVSSPIEVEVSSPPLYRKGQGSKAYQNQHRTPSFPPPHCPRRGAVSWYAAARAARAAAAAAARMNMRADKEAKAVSNSMWHAAAVEAALELVCMRVCVCVFVCACVWS